MGHGRMAALVDGAEEEEGPFLDECLCGVVDQGLDGGELERVGEGAAVEAVLELAVVVVVEARHRVLLRR